MGRFKLTCDEATTICDKNQYKEASFLDRIKLSFHFISCKFCKRYTKHNNLISLIIKGNKESLCQQKKHHLSEADKAMLQKKLDEVLH